MTNIPIIPLNIRLISDTNRNVRFSNRISVDTRVELRDFLALHRQHQKKRRGKMKAHRAYIPLTEWVAACFNYGRRTRTTLMVSALTVATRTFTGFNIAWQIIIVKYASEHYSFEM